jgi:Concanavalin A-like lectin/glucanases superfamily/Bacterial Ig-like domain (group 2)
MMKLKKISYAASVVLTMCLLHSASAQDTHWNGTVGNNAWNNPNNWLFNGTIAEVPPTQAGLDPANGGNVFLDSANGDSLITITPGDVENPGIGGENPPFNTIFGPEFGASMNNFGTLNFDWFFFPTQNDPTPANRSYVNCFTNSVIFCAGFNNTGGAGFGIGDSFFFTAGPYVTANFYANAQYTSPGGSGIWLGGHLNLYDTSMFTIDGFVNMDNAFNQSDGTRSIVVGGGTLLLPENSINASINSGTVFALIGRGVLRAYGKGEDTNDLVITDNGTNTIVTAAPLGGALQRVYFKPLLLTNVTAGTLQQATLVGDYPSVSGVLLSSSEPGLSPSSFTHPVYTSSNPNIVSVDTNGVVTAVGTGSVTLTATVGALTSTNSVAITVKPVVPGLAHRYSFATDASDSVGGANGTINGDATVAGGQLVLSGNQGSSVTLPAGIVSGMNQVTIETWATFPGSINAFANLFAFGSTDNGSPLSSTFGDGTNYITFSPHTGGLTSQANFGQGDPGNGAERDAVINTVLDNQTNMQITVVYNPFAGIDTYYTNGVLAASVTIFNNLMDPVAYAGPTYTNASILPYTLGADPLNYIGQSLYTGDPGLLANIDEFRIYNSPLTAAQIAADHALGPNQLIGTSTNVRLSASSSGGNLVIKWPTTSALVSLMSSPTLGAGAVWTPVNGMLTTDGGGNYQMTIPTTSSAQFFRLQQ